MAAKSTSDNLTQRLFTGMMLVLLLSAAIFSGRVGFFALMLVMNFLTLSEYRRLMKKAGFSLQPFLLQLTGGLLILATAFIVADSISIFAYLLFLPISLIFLVVELFRKQQQPFAHAASGLLGIGWISVSFSLFIWNGFFPFTGTVYQPTLIFGYFLILWAGDTGAFFSGKLLGRHKLFPRISPGKTWEGSIGGLLLAVATGWGVAQVIGLLSATEWMLLAIVMNVTGTAGDLIKSLLKRSIGVKDSGTLLPGHGGMLDRFDSLIGSAPFAFLFLLQHA